MESSESADDLPKGWQQRKSRSTGQVYYLNIYTKESQWEKPTCEASTKDDEKIRCSHLLVKHNESRRPSSWREDTITRTKEEAMEIAGKYLQQIESGEKEMEDLASEFSDCSSARKKGDLGYFTRGAMQKPFEDAAFALSVGELSQLVESASGIHIIKRTG
ncbi:peptidyl-prolyl cis-trans isomerase NIMA-interacting 1-like [Panonychus citri]|uniref:peptidyl-prolyl cis-trans isomerase NIMA-interacting 1-like n=1 Tax=Panonychus citri TaxID=50023 RepID=UPI0023077B4D|nr:peptidyl-prolyl cis-trans isomerase NIMA-interacting 1-like [Panonychus citri]